MLLFLDAWKQIGNRINLSEKALKKKENIYKHYKTITAMSQLTTQDIKKNNHTQWIPAWLV